MLRHGVELPISAEAVEWSRRIGETDEYWRSNDTSTATKQQQIQATGLR
jgi:hypothetical protein